MSSARPPRVCKIYRKKPKSGVDKALPKPYNIIRNQFLRSWRNRQTRTFEGRMGDRMGSSPIDRTKNPGFPTRFFLYLKCSKSLYTYSFLRVHAATWISLKSYEITMGCTRVARRLHTDLCPVFLNKRGFGKPRLHAFWRISHTANLFCLPGQERFSRCLARFAVV